MNFQIEFTNFCNLKCVECPNRIMKRKREFMKLPVVEKIISDYILPFKPSTIIMSKDGEPLMHPRFTEIVQMITDNSHAKIDLYTNGLLLKRDFIDFLASRNNIFWILLSFHFYNYDGSLNPYEALDPYIRQFLQMNRPNIEYVFASHVNRHASKEFLNTWKGVYEPLVNKRTNKLKAIHVNDHINPWAGLIQEENLSTFVTCPYADGQHMFFGVTGNILPCCMDLEEEIVFGNIMTDDKQKILEDRSQFYLDMNQGVIKHDLCKRCLNK